MRNTFICSAAMLLLSACAASGALAPSSAAQAGVAAPETLATSRITANPKELTLGLSYARPQKVTLSGGAPPFTINKYDPRIIDVSPVASAVGKWTFFVTPVASGTTKLVIADSKGASGSLVVTQEMCAPPTPEFGQIFPNVAAKNVSSKAGDVYMEEPSSDQTLKYISEFHVRLVGSDGSWVTGGAFERTNQKPPAGSATPDPGTVLSRAAYGKLKSGVTYQVYFPSRKEPCIPAQSTGTFSTK